MDGALFIGIVGEASKGLGSRKYGIDGIHDFVRGPERKIELLELERLPGRLDAFIEFAAHDLEARRIRALKAEDRLLLVADRKYRAVAIFGGGIVVPTAYIVVPTTYIVDPVAAPTVMAGLGPAIHVSRPGAEQTWTVGPSPAMTKVPSPAMTNSTLSCAARCSISYPRRGSRGCATHSRCHSSPASQPMAAIPGDRVIRHDALVRTAFRRDMRRDKGFGPALGTSRAERALRARLRDRIGAE